MSKIDLIVSKVNKSKLLEIQASGSGAINSCMDVAFLLGYNQAVQEFKDRTYTPQQYKISYSDFGKERPPIYTEDFNKAMSLVKTLEKDKMQDVLIEMVDIREESN